MDVVDMVIRLSRHRVGERTLALVQPRDGLAPRDLRRVGEMLACSREPRVRRDLIDVDVDGAELLELARDAANPGGLGEPSVPTKRQQLDEPRVRPVRL